MHHLIVRYTTLRDIAAGEELCISYGSQLTFDDVENDSNDEEISEGEEMLNKIELEL